MKIRIFWSRSTWESSELVTINQLVDIVEDIAGIEAGAEVQFEVRPKGVQQGGTFG